MRISSVTHEELTAPEDETAQITVVGQCGNRDVLYVPLDKPLDKLQTDPATGARYRLITFANGTQYRLYDPTGPAPPELLPEGKP